MNITFADEAYDSFERILSGLAGFQGALRLENQRTDDAIAVQIEEVADRGTLYVRLLDAGGNTGAPAAFDVARVQSFYVY